jgi:hypothetical protein
MHHRSTRQRGRRPSPASSRSISRIAGGIERGVQPARARRESKSGKGVVEREESWNDDALCLRSLRQPERTRRAQPPSARRARPRGSLGSRSGTRRRAILPNPAWSSRRARLRARPRAPPWKPVSPRRRTRGLSSGEAIGGRSCARPPIISAPARKRNRWNDSLRSSIHQPPSPCRPAAATNERRSGSGPLSGPRPELLIVSNRHAGVARSSRLLRGYSSYPEPVQIPRSTICERRRRLRALLTARGQTGPTLTAMLTGL